MKEFIKREKHEIVIKDIEYIIMGNYGDKTTNSVGIKSSFHDDCFELCIDPDQYKCIVEDFGTGKINHKKSRIFLNGKIEERRDDNFRESLSGI